MPSRSSPIYESDSVSNQDVESGYVSGSGSESSTPDVLFTKKHLNFLNRQLQNLEPQGAECFFSDLGISD
jgi:phosphoadenosine phosphosulfate reductase